MTPEEIVQKLKIGMPRDEVLSIIGPPDEVGGTSRKYKTPIEFTRDGDKIPCYESGKEAKQLIESILGCRTHNVIGCEIGFCKRRNCTHNIMTERKGDPNHAWECANCGYIYERD